MDVITIYPKTVEQHLTYKQLAIIFNDVFVESQAIIEPSNQIQPITAIPDSRNTI